MLAMPTAGLLQSARLLNSGAELGQARASQDLKGRLQSMIKEFPHHLPPTRLADHGRLPG